MYVDLGAERLLAAERAGQQIAVEIKSFTNASLLDYTTIPYAYGEIAIRPSFDRVHDQ
jgi:XisH protein